ncbi:hypothetical protein B296_00052827 [Ensete ventricosum]|uniref:Uncharacterized protein n=1 Tax=Ensete ventricosum TaxID=4639 RepID=A0A426X192_ENSVE|nr:hypothetical protein B296_00052827 [Ensete ventricosum]
MKTCHEQVPSRDNPGSSALAQEDDEVAPRVGRYLAGEILHHLRHSSMSECRGNRRPASKASTEMHMPRATLVLTGDGGPEDGPEEPTSGSHRLASPDLGEEMTLTLLEESEEVISTCSKNYRLKGR